MRLTLAICAVLAGIGWAQAPTLDDGRIRLAQQTVTVPSPPPSLPSILPQTQAYTSCLMGCDTTVGMCQGACSVSNSASATFGPPVPGTVRPDAGALSQCYLNCSSQQLACKRGCVAPH